MKGVVSGNIDVRIRGREDGSLCESRSDGGLQKRVVTVCWYVSKRE